MKYTAQVIYTDFTEVFEVDLKDKKLDIKLLEIKDKPLVEKEVLSLDLNTDIKSAYSSLPYESGDLTVIQVKNVFVVDCHLDNKTHWMKFTSSQLLDYLFKNDVTKQILPYINEDNQAVLNAFLSDIVRNDYSFSELNKKVKFLKVAVLLSFIRDSLNMKFVRVIFDETVLGDVDVDHIALSFRFAEQKFLKLTKISNLSKVIVVLEREGILPKGHKFQENVFFINNPSKGEKIKLVFGETGIKFDYQVLPTKNYIFDLGEKKYVMDVAGIYKENVTGKVFVYNGDERDLMIG